MNHDCKTDNAQTSNTRINIINSLYLNITKFVKKKRKKNVLEQIMWRLGTSCFNVSVRSINVQDAKVDQ